MSKYHYVYILRSERCRDQTYVGRTDNVESGLKDHNRGHCPHTSKFAPWGVQTCIAFRDMKKAVAFEKYLKSGSGREFRRRHF